MSVYKNLKGWFYVLVGASLFALIIYWMTAFRVATWWDNCSYAISASGFGVNPPPGSLLQTIIGWLVIKLPLGISDIFSINLTASFMGALSILLAGIIALRLFYDMKLSPGAFLLDKLKIYSVVGVSLGVLLFAHYFTQMVGPCRPARFLQMALFIDFIIRTRFQRPPHQRPAYSRCDYRYPHPSTPNNSFR